MIGRPNGGVTQDNLEPIWNHSEPSEVPYSPNQFLGWDFFAAFYNKTALDGWGNKYHTYSGIKC